MLRGGNARKPHETSVILSRVVYRANARRRKWIVTRVERTRREREPRKPPPPPPVAITHRPFPSLYFAVSINRRTSCNRFVISICIRDMYTRIRQVEMELRVCASQSTLCGGDAAAERSAKGMRQYSAARQTYERRTPPGAGRLSRQHKRDCHLHACYHAPPCSPRSIRTPGVRLHPIES